MAAVEKPRSRDEIATEIADLKTRITAIEEANAGVRFTEQTRAEWNDLNAQIEDLNKLDDELSAREDRILELAGRSVNVEKPDVQFPRPGVARGEDIYDLTTVARSFDDPSVEGRVLKDRALRSIDQSAFPKNRHATKETMQENVESLMATIDNESGEFARYLLSVGAPGYYRAFTKALSGAPRTQAEDQMLYRAASLTAASGGYAVPYVLDPTVIQTGDGAINPYRTIGDVQQVSVDEWRGVSSTGITAAFQAEAASATDNAPTLAQPTISTEMARAFVPFSIEIGMDWGSFASEMGTMFGDAKDVLEATKFALGSGTNEPFGVITGATTVYTASNTNSLVVADIYGVHNALGPRFRRNASWTLNNATADRIRQLDTAGGANLWVDNLQLRSAAIPNGFTDGRMGAGLLGKATFEATAQSGTFTTGQKIGVIGDYRYFKIIDRVGLTVETIPLIQASSVPTGQRGLFAYWRVGSKVLDANAFRVLKLA